jgi:hypothetical protein
MLRHLISVSLAIAACASLIPTKANAINFTLTPLGSLQRSPGSEISFIIRLDPENELLQVYTGPEIGIYDSNELFFERTELLFDFISPIYFPTDIATLVFKVIKPIKDGRPDVSARVNYWRRSDVSNPDLFVLRSILLSDNSSNSSLDVQPVPKPIPEPITIFGSGMGLGVGVLFKKMFKEIEKNKKPLKVKN